MESFGVTIITLSKNNHNEFVKTFQSIIKQNIYISERVEWLILDKSIKEIRFNNINYLKNNDPQEKLNIKYIDMNKENINGIYQSMNYGIKIALGFSIIFMNSGDEFYEIKSLKLLYENLLLLDEKKSYVFGQAQIISEEGISWNFPGKKLDNYRNWLSWFEPNHQAILSSKDLASENLFNERNIIFADGNWKRYILNHAKKMEYLPMPVCKFYLGGISSKRPSLKFLRQQIFLKEISISRKTIIFLKFLIPSFLYKYYPLFQKYKSLFFDNIF